MISCPRCGSDDTVNISIDLQDEAGLTFQACRACEEKWWHRDGHHIDLGEMLDLTQASKHSTTKVR